MDTVEEAEKMDHRYVMSPTEIENRDVVSSYFRRLWTYEPSSL